MSTVVRTQTALDAALAAGASVVEIDSPRGVWLIVRDSDSSSVEARGSSSVVARGSSSVEAWGSSSVVAWDSSSVVARGSSSVVARGSSSVEAWGSSSVVATPHVAVHLHSGRATVSGGVVIDVTHVNDTGEDWCHHHGIKVSRAGVATVYKAVDDAYLSGYRMAYTPGSKPSAPDWRDNQECGNGLHFSPTPKQARDYNPSATRFLAVGVRVADLRPIPGGTAKCKAPRVVRACVEVDIDGKPVTA